MTTKADKEEKKVEAEAEATEAEAESTGPSGPTQTPIEEHAGVAALGPSGAVEPQLLSPAAPEKEVQEREGVAGGNVADDGVEDIELGPPVLGGWVQIVAGEYAGRFAAYLGNVSLEADDAGTRPGIIQVRTRDADNLVLDVAYADVSSTTYSGGR